MAESSQPSSPGVPPISLRDCIEETLKFLFSSETLELDLGLSKDYCFHLLKDDDHTKPDVKYSEGVPMYPLYRHLASTLHDCITSGTFCKASNTMAQIQENEFLNQKENGWSKLIMDKGSELIKMVKAVGFELHVQEPFFSQLRAGLKTIEGRCAVGDYNRIAPGTLLLVNKCLLLEVKHVKWYASFFEMIKAESLAKVLPGVKTIEEGVQIYRQFYTEEKEKTNGVLAIFVSRPDAQPYVSMASIVHGLSYDGVGSLLGLMHTAGTVPDALPPPRSALLSSFIVPHKPNVKGSTLTSGARAFSKHVNRTSNGWWGSFGGSDSNKNLLALKVISHIITHCCWMNIHKVQPHDCVLEIRVAGGYGARWSRDGSKGKGHLLWGPPVFLKVKKTSEDGKIRMWIAGGPNISPLVRTSSTAQQSQYEFIGFLEPYMEDGHSKGWKH